MSQPTDDFTLTDNERAIVEEHRAKFKKIGVWKVDGKLFIARKCNLHERGILVDHMSDSSKRGQKSSQVYRTIALTCLTYPESTDEARAVLDEDPGMYDTIANRVYELAGGMQPEVQLGN